MQVMESRRNERLERLAMFSHHVRWGAARHREGSPLLGGCHTGGDTNTSAPRPPVAGGRRRGLVGAG